MVFAFFNCSLSKINRNIVYIIIQFINYIITKNLNDFSFFCKNENYYNHLIYCNLYTQKWQFVK